MRIFLKGREARPYFVPQGGATKGMCLRHNFIVSASCFWWAFFGRGDVAKVRVFSFCLGGLGALQFFLFLDHALHEAFLFRFIGIDGFFLQLWFR